MADAGIVGDHGEILGALLDQALDQRIGLADAAKPPINTTEPSRIPAIASAMLCTILLIIRPLQRSQSYPTIRIGDVSATAGITSRAKRLRLSFALSSTRPPPLSRTYSTPRPRSFRVSWRSRPACRRARSLR